MNQRGLLGGLGSEGSRQLYLSQSLQPFVVNKRKGRRREESARRPRELTSMAAGSALN